MQRIPTHISGDGTAVPLVPPPPRNIRRRAGQCPLSGVKRTCLFALQCPLLTQSGHHPKCVRVSAQRCIVPIPAYALQLPERFSAWWRIALTADLPRF